MPNVFVLLLLKINIKIVSYIINFIKTGNNRRETIKKGKWIKKMNDVYFRMFSFINKMFLTDKVDPGKAPPFFKYYCKWYINFILWYFIFTKNYE